MSDRPFCCCNEFRLKGEYRHVKTMSRPSHGGLYYIRNVASNTRMDLNNGGENNGTKVQGWASDNTENQRWTIRFAETAVGEDWFFLECRASMTRLDLSNGSSKDGTVCQGWDPVWNTAQMWRFIDEGNDRWRLRNRASGTDADLNRGSKDNGTQIQGWRSLGSNAQRWTFEEVDSHLQYSENHWDLFNFDDKIARCAHMIELAKGDPDSRHCYATAFNMSRFGLYDPIDAQQGMSGDIDRLLSSDNIGRDGQYRTGSITLDFYENNINALQNIIRSNKGCGNL